MVSAPRVDPRRPMSPGGDGRQRIVLSRADRVRQGIAVAEVAASTPVRSAGPFVRCVVVVTHAERGAVDDAARGVLAAAALLAADDCEVILAVLGACGDDAGRLGADRLLVLTDFDRSRFQPQRSLHWLAALDQAHRPTTWFFADGGDDGDLGRRHAVASDLAAVCGVVELDARTARRRATWQCDEVRPHAPVMLLAPGVAQAALPFVGLGVVGTAPSAPAEAAAAGPGIDDLGTVAGDPHTLALEEADLILAAGNGVSDLALFHAVAEALGAATAASRMAVDDGRFPRHKQVGASGRTVAAAGYLALGISGAVQHLQGIKACRHVLAVNLDAAAPIARRANLMVVEDSTALMQALLQLLREERPLEVAA